MTSSNNDKNQLDHIIGLSESEARAMLKLESQPWIDVLYEVRPGKWMEHGSTYVQRLTLKVNLAGEVVDAFWG